MDQEFCHSLTGSSVSESQRVAVKMLASMWIHLRLIWERVCLPAQLAIGSIHFLAGCYTEGQNFSLAICWNPLSFPCHVVLSIGKSQNMPACFFKTRKGESVSQQACNYKHYQRSNILLPMLYYWIDESHRFCPYSRGGDYTQVLTPGERNQGALS